MMETTRGRVITFYSYKGGTGRSMAVANIACLLSRRADVTKGVLIIDWDLDAPGLHWFFSTNLSGVGDERFSLTHDGVVELFRSIRELLPVRVEPASEDETEAIIRKINFSRFIIDTDVPKVKLMPAGRFSGDYVDEVARFDWRALFHAAPTVVRAFAEAIADQYEYVLIDSRTGLNDISGICTALLPDQIVLVFTPNRQSLIGGIEIAKRGVAYRRESEDIRPLIVYPLPSRVEMSEPVLLEKWRFGDSLRQADQHGYQRRFQSLFLEVYSLTTCDLENYFDEIQIQHVPRYSYGEDIAARHERGTRLSLSRSYAAFADILVKGDPPWDVPRSTQGGRELVSDVPPGAIKVQAAKDYLAEDRFKLKLHDLVASEVKGILAEIARMPLQGTPNIAGLAERLHTYEGITNDLILIQALVAYWGNANHSKTLILGPKQISETVTPASGLTSYLSAYPALLLLYSGGIAAVAGGRYDNLRNLMLFPAHNYNGNPDGRATFIVPVTRTILDLERMDAFKRLPGFERRYAAKSDYLYSLLDRLVGDVLLLGSEYERAFDQFELLYALEYCNQTARGEASDFWGPIGRFGWKRAVLREMLDEAETEKNSWGPIQAGLFDSSFERFKVVWTGFSELIRGLRWH